MGPQVAEIELPSPTEIVQYLSWNDLLTADANVVASEMPGQWPTRINVGSVYGIGHVPFGSKLVSGPLAGF